MEQKPDEQAYKDIQEVLKKYSLKIEYNIAFPIYNILPDEVELALKILAKHGMKISFILSSNKSVLP